MLYTLYFMAGEKKKKSSWNESFLEDFNEYQMTTSQYHDTMLNKSVYENEINHDDY